MNREQQLLGRTMQVVRQNEDLLNLMTLEADSGNGNFHQLYITFKGLL